MSDQAKQQPKGGGALLAAALALPGVLPHAAQAQVTVPNATLVQFKYLYYRDYQDSGDRMTIHSPALYMLAPISTDWVFEIGAVHDSISGASPYYLVAALTFDSMAAIHAALASPEGQATAADLANFATAGVDLYFADTREI